MADLRERPTIGMSFEEEAKLFEEEARAEFAKETGCGDAEGVNNILRRGMRIVRKARKEIAHGVTVQEWISVEDRLPEIYDKEPDWSVTVLFRTTQGHIHSGYRNIGRPQRSFYDDDWTPPYWLDESENLSFEEDEVTHWMPLPEPPEKGE